MPGTWSLNRPRVCATSLPPCAKKYWAAPPAICPTTQQSKCRTRSIRERWHQLLQAKTASKRQIKAAQQGHTALHAFLTDAKAKDVAWGRRKRKYGTHPPFPNMPRIALPPMPFNAFPLSCRHTFHIGIAANSAIGQCGNGRFLSKETMQ